MCDTIAKRTSFMHGWMGAISVLPWWKGVARRPRCGLGGGQHGKDYIAMAERTDQASEGKRGAQRTI